MVRKRRSRNLGRTLVCTIFLGALFVVYPQSQISFRQLSVHEGLSQNSAVSITQDSIGYLWIATQDGLNKYDGRKFTVYPYTFTDITKPGYSNLGKVYTDTEGGLWIIPTDQIPRQFNYDTQRFMMVPGVANASVLFQDSKSQLWIGTYSSGLYLKKKGSKQVLQVLPAEELPGTVFNIAQKQSGTLLLATEGAIMEYTEGQSKPRVLQLKSATGTAIETNFSDVVVDNENREWIGTFGNGLYLRDDSAQDLKRVAAYSFTDSLPENLNILDLHMDKKNRLWIATYGNGLYMLNLEEHSIHHFSAKKHNPRALHYNDILCIYEDYSGTLWFGTDGAGASFYDEFLEKFNSMTNYQTPEEISIDVVRAIAVGPDRSIWIGTSGKGLTHFMPETGDWQTFKTDLPTKNTVASNRVMSLLVDDNHNLWIGTQGAGLDIYTPDGQFVHYGLESEIPLSAKTIWHIHKDKNDRVWLGTREQGLIQFHPEMGEVKKYKYKLTDKEGVPSNNIRVIAPADGANLWIGTEAQGISLFKPEEESFQKITPKDTTGNLAGSHIKSLYESPAGILWIGTNGGGLHALDLASHNYYQYTVKDGLPNNVIYAILPDEQGNLWLSSNKGITKFTPGKTLALAPRIVNYANYDGLATEFNTGAYYKANDGHLYFGGLEGFYWFKPEEIKENTILPKTTITGLEVSNESYPLKSGARLRHDQNTFTFTFSSLQYSLPEKNLYQYKLENYDEDWIRSENTNFARYSYIPPGDYEFMVKSSNYDGVWNEEPVSYKFSIAAPWYLTDLAKAIYAILILLAAYAVYAYFRWRWKVILSLQIKEAEAQRLQRLNDFKSKLYTDISHEFRTPLTLIAGPLDTKLSKGNLSKKDQASFSMMKRNIKRLISLVDQLLDLAKLEKGGLKLKIIQGNLGLFLKTIASSFEYYAKEKYMQYDFQVDELPDKGYDEDVIEKIVTNLLSNAIKYSPKNGRCHLRARRQSEQLLISVSNTVQGVTEKDIDKMFHRFYQKDEHAEGAGIGLSLVKELVHLYSGKVSVQLLDGPMIQIDVALPLNLKLLKAFELVADNKKDPLPSLPSSAKSVVPEPERVEQLSKAALPIVLIVEDHKEIRDFLRSNWKQYFRVYEAENGREGIAKAREIVPDLIISDVRMPKGDGIELCKILKTDERTSHIPIILLTAGTGEEEELKGLRSGADDFIAKPFKLKVLEKRALNLIETRKALRSRYSQEVILKARDIAITPTDEVFLNRVQHVLDDRLANPGFNATTFSRLVGMSRMQLHRKLLAYTGLSTTAFIRSQRLKQALHILQTSDVSVNEVGYAVGFNTPSYFIKCFKETYKKTPLEYLQTTDK